MTKSRVADFLTDWLKRVVLVAVVLVLVPVVLDYSYNEVNTDPALRAWSEHQKNAGPAGLITLMWIDGWGGTAYDAAGNPIP